MVNEELETYQEDYGTLVRGLAAEAYRVLAESVATESAAEHELAKLARRIVRLERQLEGPGLVDLRLWLKTLREQVQERLDATATRGTKAGERVRLPAATTR